MKNKILILGTGGNAGINFSRSLNLSNDFELVGCDTDEYFINHSVCKDNYLISKNKDEKINQLKRIINDHGITMIHAQPDPEVQFLLQNKEIFKNYIFDHNYETWKVFRNKYECQRIWNEKLNLNFEIAKFDSLTQLEFDRLLKNNKRVWVRAIEGAGSKAALPVATYDQAKNWINYWIEFKGMSSSQFMICEYLPGREFAVQMLWNKGELIHSQARQRIRYIFEGIMPSGQSSTPSVAKTINEDSIYKMAEIFIKTIDSNPNGIYCIDMKENSNNLLIPTEVNYGRFFTTSYFFSVLGVNSPVDYVNLFLNKNVEKKINYIKDEYTCIRGIDTEPKIIKT